MKGRTKKDRERERGTKTETETDIVQSQLQTQNEKKHQQNITMAETKVTETDREETHPVHGNQNRKKDRKSRWRGPALTIKLD